MGWMYRASGSSDLKNVSSRNLYLDLTQLVKSLLRIRYVTISVQEIFNFDSIFVFDWITEINVSPNANFANIASGGVI